jgi:hypothetical protein
MLRILKPTAERAGLDLPIIIFTSSGYPPDHVSQGFKASAGVVGPH